MCKFIGFILDPTLGGGFLENNKNDRKYCLYKVLCRLFGHKFEHAISDLYVCKRCGQELEADKKNKGDNNE